MDVVENTMLCENHFLIRLACNGFPGSLPGQFVQVQCRPVNEIPDYKEAQWDQSNPPKLSQPELTGEESLLRRPLSLAGRAGDIIDIIYRVAGTGTRWLSKVAAGGKVSVIGPLGNAFEVKSDKELAMLVGGGVGIPPMIYLASWLGKVCKTVAFCGVRNKHMIPLSLDESQEVLTDGTPSMCVREFAKNSVSAVLSSDDGSLGYPGLVCEPFGKYIDNCGLGAEKIAVYTCGPELMMKAVAQMCIERGIDCQVSLERHMACGMGTCQSCVCKIKADNEKGYIYKLCCSDGPVFDANIIVWK